MILTELKKTPRAQRRSKALVLWLWSITIGVCVGMAVINATPTSGPAWGCAAVALWASLVTWLIVRN